MTRSTDELVADALEVAGSARSLNHSWSKDELATALETLAAELARRAEQADALLEALSCEHTLGQRDEETERLWTYVEYEGKTWNRCRSCGVLELWAAGQRITVALAATEPAAADPEPREGMVMVYDWNRRYLGCMGIETWQGLLAEPAAADEGVDGR